MLFYRIFPAIAAGCAALMDIQRAKVDNGWLLFCVLVSLFTRIWKMDVSSLETWICGLLVPILILGILFIFRMLGAGDIKLLSVIGSMIGPTKILNCIFLFLSDWSCYISCSYDFKRHCLPANSLLITLHQCLF